MDGDVESHCFWLLINTILYICVAIRKKKKNIRINTFKHFHIKLHTLSFLIHKLEYKNFKVWLQRLLARDY